MAIINTIKPHGIAMNAGTSLGRNGMGLIKMGGGVYYGDYLLLVG